MSREDATIETKSRLKRATAGKRAKRLAGAVFNLGVGRALALALLVAFLALRAWDPPPLAEIRNRTFDMFQIMMPRTATAFPVAIIDIDEASLRAEGQWPWPRTLVAELVRRATDLGAVAIGFDVVFAEPDRYSPNTIASLVPDLDALTRQQIAKLPSNDDVLAHAFAASHVVVGESGVQKLPNSTPPPQVSMATIGPDPKGYLVAFPDILHNVPVLDKAAAGQGLFTIRAERDGIVRRVPMLMRVADVVVPALSLEMLRVATGGGPIVVRSNQAGLASVVVRGVVIPTDRNGQVWVHFAPHDPRRYISAQDLLAGRVPRDKLDHKLVLVGTSAIGLLDRQTTPVDSSMPGVEIHAQILENALTNSWISYPSYGIAIELVLTAVVALAIIIFVPIVGAATVAVLGAAAAASMAGLAWYLYARQGVLLDVTFASLATLTIYAVLVFTNYLREEAQRQRIRNAFRYYLSPALVEELAKAPEKLVLGGEERQMTIMFSDVRGFTAISETYKQDPQGLTKLMNRLLTPLTNAIIEHNGTIDKYMGDAIMAFWNAPLNDAEHSRNACAAALEMHKRLATLNEARAEEAKNSGAAFLPIRIGVGINSGTCVVGNMGSDLRFDYSVLGDVVNLTSRIEGQTKTYGVPIIAGANTIQAAGDHLAVLELDRIRVKGKTEPEVIYAILGASEVKNADGFLRLSALYRQMLAHYRRRDWGSATDAIASLRPLGRDFGLETLLNVYTTRIGSYVQNPPPEDWDGVYIATEK